MGKITGILLFLLFIGNSLYSQLHQSYDNNTGDWSDPGTWEAGTGILVPGDQIDIYGYVTLNGDLDLDNGKYMDVYDTLVVTGNLTMFCNILPPWSTLTVHEDGLLIILGDMTGTHSFTFVDGVLIVVGEVDLDNLILPPIGVGGHAYFFDDDPVIDPFPPPNIEDEDDIPPGLDDFLDDVQCIATDTEDPVLNLPAIGPFQCNSDVPAIYADSVFKLRMPNPLR